MKHSINNASLIQVYDDKSKRLDKLGTIVGWGVFSLIISDKAKETFMLADQINCLRYNILKLCQKSEELADGIDIKKTKLFPRR